MEKHSRTILKTVSWRILATSTTLILVYIFTNNIFASLGVGILETILKTMLYYLHERLWNKTSYGIKIEDFLLLQYLRCSDSQEKNAQNQKENNL